MGTRAALQSLLETVPGIGKVYFQPPATVQMVYPCIIFEQAPEWSVHADNRPYAHKDRYTLTVIDRDAESKIPGYISKLPLCAQNRIFTNDNLYHWVYSLYY